MTGSPLISVDELRTALAAGTPPAVLDVRYRLGGPGPVEFRAGHVPGAAYVDLDAELAGPPGARGRHPLPDPSTFGQAMRRAGVSGDRPVVVVDDWQGRAAARAWWLLRFHGHPDVHVLDGGWSAWVEAGGEVATGPEEPRQAGDFAPTPGGGMPVVGAADLRDVDVLVDARAPERYRGEIEPIDPVAGHVPGAVNVPTTENVDQRGRFRPPAELRDVYAAVGVSADRTVAAYCGSGVTAAHDVLALAVAGIPAALYPGSWSEWVTDPARPVATG